MVIRYFTLIFICFLIPSLMLSQSDPNNDPNWDWRASTSYTVYPQLPYGAPVYVTSPFYQGGIGEAVFDNDPEDGWRLVMRDFGTPTRGQAIPDFVLYNVHQGLLRIFVLTYVPNTFTNGSIELFFGSTNRTAALTFLQPRAYALDKIDSVKDNRSGSITPVANNYWAFSDFPIAYDPNTANIQNPRFHFRVWGTQVSDINLSGVGNINQLLGTNQPANVPTKNNPFSEGGVLNTLGKSVYGTYESWNKWREGIEKIANNIDSNSTSSAVRNYRRDLLAVAKSWLVSNLGGIGVGVALVDFMIAGGRKNNQERPAPMNFLLNFTLTGTMTTQHLVSPGITLPVPGAKHTEQAIPVNLLYNQPLGIFNLTATPVIEGRWYWEYYSPNVYRKLRSYRLKENLTYAINPNAGISLEKMEVAMLCQPPDVYVPEFLQWADQGRVKLESANNGKYVFSTEYLPADLLPRVPLVMNVPPGCDMTFKVKAVFKRNDATPETQPIIFVATYEPVFEDCGTGDKWITYNCEIAQAVSEGISGGYYKINGKNIGLSFSGQLFDQDVIEAVPPTGYSFSCWSDGSTSNPRIVRGPITATALYKGVHVTNNANTFANNSQRKVVRTQDGWLHQVYESAGRVWLEHSSDNGATWFLGNNRQPLDNGEGKCPSIGWGYTNLYGSGPDEHLIVVVYQEKYGSTYKIKYATFKRIGDVYENQTPEAYAVVYTEPTDGYTVNANPSIAMCRTGSGVYDFVVAFERKSGSTAGINWIYGKMAYNGVYPTYDNYVGPVHISGTDANSVNAAVHLNESAQSSESGVFDVVFQHNTGSNQSQIKDILLVCTYNGVKNWDVTQVGNPVIISVGAKKNYNPSIVQTPTFYIRACWIRDVTGDGGSPWWINAVSYDMASSTYKIFGSWEVRSVSLNMRDDNVAFLAWSEAQSPGSSGSKNCVSKGTTVLQLNTTGRYVQLSNGPLNGNSTNMVVSSLKTEGMPYSFQTSGPIGTGLQKRGEGGVNEGRGAVFAWGENALWYSLKSVRVGNKQIGFVEIPETTIAVGKLRRQKEMKKWDVGRINTILVSEGFMVGEDGIISFSEECGIADTIEAMKSLKKGEYLSYRLELEDAETGKVLGVIREGRISGKELTLPRFSSYQAKIRQRNGKQVRVRVRFQTNIEGVSCKLVEEYGTINDQTLAKMEKEEIVMVSEMLPTTYGLEQNYPNPFNPVTTLRYEVPEAARVTLKVYDMTGREVTTLVDGVVEAGYHSVQFDGSGYASGVYFVRMTAYGSENKPYVKVQKMVLMK